MILYVEPFAGASGDMLLGGLLGLGVPLEHLRGGLSSLDLPGWRLDYEQVERCYLSAHRALVSVPQEHHHRHLSDILQLLEQAELPDRVRERASLVFRRLARAEAEVHGIDIEQVHFHEVGAADAILDVVGFALGLEWLGIDHIYCASFPLGEGQVICQHGRMPNPAPATMRLLEGWPLRSVDSRSELVTPTGAAILTALGQPGRPQGVFTLAASALGAGARQFDFPNVVRLSLGGCGEAGWESLVTLESHLDDCSPEWLGNLLELLLEAGALEVSFEPVTLKKSRSGHRLWVLARPEQSDQLANLVLTESTSLGVRRQPVERRSLARRLEEVATPYGPLTLKLATDPDGRIRATPEFEQARALARQHQVPLRLVFEAGLKAFWKEEYAQEKNVNN
ncbi:MAG: nickel pincer cofactor biosynthesis protein LarC [Candidatus Eremiobacteraeota bacterium]|nr:nickel pincer cofactor biosynthesis protein LarC [Candidatus Eremiobacteraeota bacterium]